MRIKIQEYHKEQDMIEFTIEEVDYECNYNEETILQTYPVSHNSITNTTDCETESFQYKFPVMESLKRMDGIMIGDPEGICRHLELKINM